MSRLKPVTFGPGETGYRFDCPGCGEPHSVPTVGPMAWGFNGDISRPTFSPSILVRGVFPIMAGEKVAPSQFICHSFVRDGRIQFLGDCTHALAGQTVDLPEVES